MSDHRPKEVLVTDLDNTLWDWFAAWHASFSAMLGRLVELSGVPRNILEQQIREIHQRRKTTEYSFLINEIPALLDAAAPNDPAITFDGASHILNSQRRATTKLYPGVQYTLRRLKERGVRIVAYTESVAYWTEWRIRYLQLDGVIDVLYSAPDHDFPVDISIEQLRRLPASEYGLRRTQHCHVARGLVKPNVDVLHSILDEQKIKPEQAVYIGDSLMKDIAMAQGAHVLDVHAKYGEAQRRPEYDLLRRVSHWSDEDVAREREMTRSTGTITPTITCGHSFSEVATAFRGNLKDGS